MRPEQIEKKSFQLIEARVPSHPFNRRQWSVVKRMIHATADFELVHTTVFHPRALPAGIKALRGGAAIITDTNMVKAGISLKRLRAYGTNVCCAISRQAVAREARISGKTRAAAAMRALAPLMKGALVAVGNAPTALCEVLSIAGNKAHRPALIIGVPVGMVGAAESKELLIASGLPFITVRGEKGGSPLAASMVNALALLAEENKHE
jgi:precorrin-8X/cobalt-precorrin-8 methylmutase